MGNNGPHWIDSTIVEKEIYLSVLDGTAIPVDQLSSHKEYIHGIFIPAPLHCPADSCPIIDKSITFLYCHGNSGNIFRYWYRAVALWNMGANVFIFDYRGYGLSKGETSRSNIKRDTEMAATYIKSRADVDTNSIIVYGYSMGAIPSSYVAGISSHKNRFAGIIIESGLDSPEELVGLSTGTDFPDGFFLDDTPFNGPEFINHITIPCLHMHGSEDRRVIIQQAHRYYNVLQGRPNYTHYIGKSSKLHEEWIITTKHRNIPFYSFSADMQITDYWNDSKNPSHCCVNPDELDEPQFSEFLRSVGRTTGAEMKVSSQKYEDLVTAWVKSIIP
jgi:predicted esterase